MSQLLVVGDDGAADLSRSGARDVVISIRDACGVGDVGAGMRRRRRSRLFTGPTQHRTLLGLLMKMRMMRIRLELVEMMVVMVVVVVLVVLLVKMTRHHCLRRRGRRCSRHDDLHPSAPGATGQPSRHLVGTHSRYTARSTMPRM